MISEERRKGWLMLISGDGPGREQNLSTSEMREQYQTRGCSVSTEFPSFLLSSPSPLPTASTSRLPVFHLSQFGFFCRS